MQFDLVIFDFDGTLVDSNFAKYRAFFDIFPQEPLFTDIVRAVLTADPEGSRETVIPEMIRRMRAAGGALTQDFDATEKVRQYGRLTEVNVGRCGEIFGASALLAALHSSGVKVVISSSTPQDVLTKFVAARGWSGLVQETVGFPATKRRTAERLLRENGIAPSRLAIVGDGESDRDAAVHVGATFFAVRQHDDLRRLGTVWGYHDV